MPEAEENESVLLGGKSTLSPIESPHSLKLTANLPPEKWWLGDDLFLLGFCQFSGAKCC